MGALKQYYIEFQETEELDNSDDSEFYNWLEKETKKQQVDRIVDYNTLLKEERKEYWKTLSQQYI